MQSLKVRSFSADDMTGQWWRTKIEKESYKVTYFCCHVSSDVCLSFSRWRCLGKSFLCLWYFPLSWTRFVIGNSVSFSHPAKGKGKWYFLSSKVLNIWTPTRVMVKKYSVQGSPFDNILTPIRVSRYLHGRGSAYAVVELPQNSNITVSKEMCTSIISKNPLRRVNTTPAKVIVWNRCPGTQAPFGKRPPAVAALLENCIWMFAKFKIERQNAENCKTLMWEIKWKR